MDEDDTRWLNGVFVNAFVFVEMHMRKFEFILFLSIDLEQVIKIRATRQMVIW